MEPPTSSNFGEKKPVSTHFSSLGVQSWGWGPPPQGAKEQHVFCFLCVWISAGFLRPMTIKWFKIDQNNYVGKTIINHLSNHHQITINRWYKPFPNGWCIIVLPTLEVCFFNRGCCSCWLSCRCQMKLRFQRRFGPWASGCLIWLGCRRAGVLSVCYWSCKINAIDHPRYNVRPPR